VLVIEDDTYRELSFDGPAPESLWSLGPPGTVVRLGSFAKTVAPGLRVGFVNGTPELVRRVANSGLLDSGGGITHFAALVLAEYARSGRYARHVAQLRAAYRRRRDALITSLADRIFLDSELTAPSGGFFVWLRLAKAIELSDLTQGARRVGVGFMPAGPFYPRGAAPEHAIRLAFSMYPVGKLAEGGRRLGLAMQASRR
jgi:2-aminoadipate transaminase